jgi:hypothetical protein
MSNSDVTLTSVNGIYIAICSSSLATQVQAYIDAVEGRFPLLKSCFGMEPQIDRYTVRFGSRGTCYGPGGNIWLSNDEANLNRTPPDCFDGGLVFETIHGFLEPLRHPPNGYDESRIGENRLGESFSTIIEIDFLNKVSAIQAAKRHREGAGMKPYHHPLLFALVEIYDSHQIEVFQKLLSFIDKEGKSGTLLFSVEEYGQEYRDPYDQIYMGRLAEVFQASAGIDVVNILQKYVEKENV